MAKFVIDADDTLFRTAEGFTRFSNEHFGTQLTADDYSEDWEAMWQVSREVVDERAEVYHEQGVVSSYPPMEGAHFVLHALRRRGHRFAVATSRERELRNETRLAVARHYMGLIALNDIRHAGIWDGNYDSTACHKTKGDLFVEMGADYVIDDHPKHCIAAAERGIGAFLFGDYAWNRDVEVPESVIRVASWGEILEFFNEQSRQSFYAASA